MNSPVGQDTETVGTLWEFSAATSITGSLASDIRLTMHADRRTYDRFVTDAEITRALKEGVPVPADIDGVQVVSHGGVTVVFSRDGPCFSVMTVWRDNDPLSGAWRDARNEYTYIVRMYPLNGEIFILGLSDTGCRVGVGHRVASEVHGPHKQKLRFHVAFSDLTEEMSIHPLGFMRMRMEVLGRRVHAFVDVHSTSDVSQTESWNRLRCRDLLPVWFETQALLKRFGRLAQNSPSHLPAGSYSDGNPNYIQFWFPVSVPTATVPLPEYFPSSPLFFMLVTGKNRTASSNDNFAPPTFLNLAMGAWETEMRPNIVWARQSMLYDPFGTLPEMLAYGASSDRPKFWTSFDPKYPKGIHRDYCCTAQQATGQANLSAAAVHACGRQASRLASFAALYRYIGKHWRLDAWKAAQLCRSDWLRQVFEQHESGDCGHDRFEAVSGQHATAPPDLALCPIPAGDSLLNRYDEAGMTPLLYACWSDRLETARWLVEHGANLYLPRRETAGHEFQSTAWHWALLSRKGSQTLQFLAEVYHASLRDALFGRSLHVGSLLRRWYRKPHEYEKVLAILESPSLCEAWALEQQVVPRENIDQLRSVLHARLWNKGPSTLWGRLSEEARRRVETLLRGWDGVPPEQTFALWAVDTEDDCDFVPVATEENDEHWDDIQAL